jgi:hypothetical protein
METKHHDSVEYFKHLESKINKRIHSLTNSRSFILASGRALELHLKRLKVHKELTTRWLKMMDLPNKDEIAEVSLKLVDCEERLDTLDETIYSIGMTEKVNLEQLKLFRESAEELLKILKQEVADIHDGKLVTLEKDLSELKRLFETFDNGGDRND